MAARARRRARTFAANRAWRPSKAPKQKPLLIATDHGHPVAVSPGVFASQQARDGWGPAADSFLRLNEKALATLDVRAEIVPRPRGPELRLVPGGTAGAIPLRAAQTGHVVGGLVVRPRFGWAGVGRVLSETGWHAAPEFADLPLVPGSGREVPPWVLAGPVIARIAELLRHLRRGYRVVEATLARPRGRILWQPYTSRSLAHGAWHRMPCRFPDLAGDLHLRRIARWSLERVRRELLAAGGTDPVAAALAAIARRLIDTLDDVAPLMPQRDELRRRLGADAFLETALRQGVEAMAWIVEERGLGGGREQDGLAWSLPLERLWESYVEAVAAARGGARRRRAARRAPRPDDVPAALEPRRPARHRPPGARLRPAARRRRRGRGRQVQGPLRRTRRVALERTRRRDAPSAPR